MEKEENKLEKSKSKDGATSTNDNLAPENKGKHFVLRNTQWYAIKGFCIFSFLSELIC